MDEHNSRGRYRYWDIASFKERHQISLYDIMIYGKKNFYYYIKLFYVNFFLQSILVEMLNRT